MTMLLFGLLVKVVTVQQISAAMTTELTCRSKFGNFEPEVFKIHACAWCYAFVTQARNVQVHSAMHTLVFWSSNQTRIPKWTILVADADNQTLSDHVCRTTTPDLCSSWRRCCHEASQCCHNQMSDTSRDNSTCPRTWDGYGCWEDAAPGATVYTSCPSFLKYSITSRYAEKHCTTEGSWFVKGNGSSKDSEWTDYTKCLDKDSYLTSIYLGWSCNVASILLLVPSVGIFLLYRSLRKQHRIRLHINLFLSLVLANLLTILWDLLVTHQKLTLSTESSIVQKESACKVLAFLRLYFRSTTYVWMFVEGFYLHRLVSNAFRPPKSLLFLYLIGWGVPLLYNAIYAVLRLVYANDTCWIKSTGGIQWILYTPNLGCLIANMLFLCNILRILLTQLQSHPNEPSNFRRALKATFVLIPLFGVQLFATVYRLPAGSRGANFYENFSVVVQNSQGFLVALIFCFFNGEVISHVRRTCTRLRLMRSLQTDMSRGQTTATSVNFMNQGPDSHESENGNLAYESPRGSPTLNKKMYNSIEPQERKYPYIPLVTRQPANGQN